MGNKTPATKNMPALDFKLSLSLINNIGRTLKESHSETVLEQVNQCQ